MKMIRLDAVIKFLQAIEDDDVPKDERAIEALAAPVSGRDAVRARLAAKRQPDDES